MMMNIVVEVAVMVDVVVVVLLMVVVLKRGGRGCSVHVAQLHLYDGQKKIQIECARCPQQMLDAYG